MAKPAKAADAAKEQALAVAARAALRTGTLPATFRALVSEQRTKTEGYRRVAHEIERRQVVLRVEPAPGARARDLGTPPHPGARPEPEPGPGQ